jgi:RNA polymerase sigma-70 factor (ECF subfamily)
MTVRLLASPLPPRESPSDEALLAACAAGDPSALATLFERHQLRIRRFASRMLGGRDAEDVVQSTFLVAWERARRFRGDASVFEWLLGISAHQARRVRRMESRRRLAMRALGREPQRPVAPPHDALARDESLARLRAAVDSLPHHLRAVFLLCEVEDLSGVEVARALGLPAGTVWRRLHQARARLRAALEEDA